MLKNYFKIAARNLIRHKVFSFINIFGLAVGMASFIFLLLWVQDELSFDSFHKNKNEIYRVVGDWSKNKWTGYEGTPSPLAEAIKTEIPEIKNAVRIAHRPREVFKIGQIFFYEEGGAIVDPSLFEIFSFPLIKGNPKSAFSEPNSILLNEKLSEKYFGNENPVGKMIEIDGKPSTVTGVFKNIPSNSHLQFNYISSFQFVNEFVRTRTDWSAFNFLTYVQLKHATNEQDVSNKITKIALANNCGQVMGGATFRLQPLSKIHLEAKKYNRPLMVTGDSKLVYAFSIIAFFVLLIASINFINLSTARSIYRTKEIGLRKTLGADRSQLAGQFMGESMLLTFLAMTIALFLVIIFMPKFNSFSGKELSITISDKTFFITLVLTFFITCLLAGVYPALYLSSFRPVKILQSKFHAGKRGVAIRTILVVFQFTLSIILIIGTIIFNNQLHYIRQMDLGFDKENVLALPLQQSIAEKYTTVKVELLRSPDVLSVSVHNHAIFLPNHNSGFQWEGMNINRGRDLDLILSGVDNDFINTLNIKIVEGNNFQNNVPADESSVILNESAIKEMDLKAPVGKWISLGEFYKATIIGVVKDVHFQYAHKKIEPRMFYCSKSFNGRMGGIVLIKMKNQNASAVIAHAKKVWQNVNSFVPFEYFFLDETYNNLYKVDVKAGTIVTYFSFWAIFISCLGLFGLSFIMSEQRTKEIGIRKTLGATVPQIAVMFSKDFVKWVAVAFVIACPIAWHAMSQWLQDFAYRIDITIWPFLLAGFLALVITLLTVSCQAIKVATANPVESLRYE